MHPYCGTVVHSPTHSDAHTLSFLSLSLIVLLSSSSLTNDMPAGIPSADASIDVPSDVDVSPVAFEVAPTSFPSLSAARDYFIHHPHTLAVGQYFGHWLNVRHMLGRVPSPSDRHLLTLRVDKIRIEGRNGRSTIHSHSQTQRQRTRINKTSKPRMNKAQ